MPTSDFDTTNLKQHTRAGLNIAAAGTAFPGAGSGNGLRIRNNGRRVLRIRNGGGAAVTISTLIGKTVDGSTVAPRTQSVPAAGDFTFGPWPASYNDSQGFVTVEASAITSVTYDVLELPAV